MSVRLEQETVNMKIILKNLGAKNFSILETVIVKIYSVSSPYDAFLNGPIGGIFRITYLLTVKKYEGNVRSLMPQS
jgi:hypothetical protein